MVGNRVKGRYLAIGNCPDTAFQLKCCFSRERQHEDTGIRILSGYREHTGDQHGRFACASSGVDESVSCQWRERSMLLGIQAVLASAFTNEKICIRLSKRQRLNFGPDGMNGISSGGFHFEKLLSYK